MPTKKLLPLIALGFLCVLPSLVRAQEAVSSTVPKVDLSCVSKNTAVDENRVFPIVRGQGVELGCTLVNATQEKLSGMLLGKQYANGAIAASSMAVNLDEGARQEVTLPFPPIFVSGTYRYSAMLIGSDNQPLSADVVLTGMLDGEQSLMIESAILDKKVYAWGDTAKLSLALSAGGEEDSLLKIKAPMLKVSLLDVEQKDCAVLLNEQVVTGAVAEYSFELSPKVNCINTIQVTLLGKEGGVMDQKIVAFPLAEQETAAQNALKQSSSGSGKKMMTALLVGIAGIILLVGAYFVWRRKSR